jgi:hypothetical protein
MDGWMNGWMDGCMDGWMDGWMDGEVLIRYLDKWMTCRTPFGLAFWGRVR